MSEPRRSRWVFDLWDEEHDPAQIRMREAMALKPPPEPDQPPPPPIVATRELVADLRQRAAAGDRLAQSKLAEWLRRLRG